MKFKNLVSGLLAFAVAISCFCGVTYAETGDYSADVYAFEVKIAQGLGAIDEYDAEKLVTVGDFKKAITALGALPEQYFKNTKADKNEIKLKDAAVILCDMLGYGFYADSASSENINAQLVSIAQRYGLLKNVSSGTEESFTMEDLVSIIYNVLEAKTFSIRYTNDGPLASVTNKKYIANALNMEYINGIVEKTRYSAITDVEGTGCDQIVISGVTYDCDIENFEAYVGTRVKALISRDNNKKTCLALFDDGNTVCIDADDIYAKGVTRNGITYYNNKNKKQELKLSSTVDVLYNFESYANWTVNDFKITQGRLICTDNDGDGRYDVVKIEEYKSMVIFSASVTAMKISNSVGETLSIEKLIKRDLPVYNNGKRIIPDNITKGSVATYYLNKANDIVRIDITSDDAAGTIVKFKKDKDIVVLDDKEYSYTDEVKADIEKVALGSSIIVSLNIYGEIAEFSVAKSQFLYGYMISFASDGLDGIKVKMYTQTGEFKTMDTAAAVDINGIRRPAADAFAYNLTTGLWDETGVVNQMVRYKVNLKDEIIALRTSTNYEDPSCPDRLLKAKDGNYAYNGNARTISGDTRIDDNTKVFIIPEDLQNKRVYDAGGRELIDRWNYKNLTMQVYDVDEDRIAGVVVIRQDDSSSVGIADYYCPIYVVESVGEALNDYGELTTMVNAYTLGQTEITRKEILFFNSDVNTVYAGEQIYVGQLKPGDVFMVSDDTKLISIRFRPGISAPFEAPKGYMQAESTKRRFYGDCRTEAYGEVIRIVKNGVIMNNKPKDTADYDEWNRIINLNGPEIVSIFDYSTGELTRGSIADLVKGDMVYYVVNSAIAPTEMVIIRNLP